MSAGVKGKKRPKQYLEIVGLGGSVSKEPGSLDKKE